MKEQIEYDMTDVQREQFTDLQLRMAAELADQINGSLRWEDLTPEQAAQVLRFLVQRLEDK